MPKRNYGHEKRQKELNKQRKKEEKLQRRHERASTSTEDAPGDDTQAAEPSSEE